MDAQPRITDLIPRKTSTLALFFLAGLLVVVGLEALYAWMPRLAGMTTDGHVAAFDLDSEGSLGAWFSSLVLLASSLTALLVWSLRRHRLDDYHGRYRIWFWAAACWCVMSIDEACSLHEGFKEMMSHLTGTRIYGDGSLWWVMAYGVVLGTVGIRLTLEMRSCRASTAALVLAGICWVVAIVAQVEAIMPRTGARGVMVEEGCEMLGDLLLLLSMTVHARYIIRDVQGADGASEQKPKRRRKVATKEGDAEVEGKASAEGASKSASIEPSKTPTRPPVTVRAQQPASPAAKAAAPAKPSTTQPSTTQQVGSKLLRTDPPEDPLAHRKLSKQERRAMRRAEKADDDD